MIIGRGDVASVIKDREGFTFFCTGVSNREPITDRQKQQELNRIWRSSRDGMFVYISTLSVYYSDSEYTQHKRDMENLVRRTFDNFCIIRIGNITWGTNPNTLCNFLKSQIHNGETLDVQDTHRYLLDPEELNHWIGLIPSTGKHEMNVTGKRLKVERIVELIRENRI